MRSIRSTKPKPRHSPARSTFRSTSPSRKPISQYGTSMSQPANILNIAIELAPHTYDLSHKAFTLALKEELLGKRCLHSPRLAPTESAGTIRYGSVRSVKFEFPEMERA